jgi:hypothetical protein
MWVTGAPAEPARPQPADMSAPTKNEVKMKNHLNALLLTAALSGLVGGTSVAANAATNPNSAKTNVAKAGLLRVGQDTPPAKHSCKGKNDCKGSGGCKSSDNGCKGKNSCKGKGGCATDGSKKPSFV